MIRWIILIISLMIGSFCLLTYAYHAWLTATPLYDPDMHRVYSLIWLCAGLTVMGAGGVLFVRLKRK